MVPLVGFSRAARSASSFIRTRLIRSVLILLAAASPVGATSYSWVASLNGNWSNPTNWSPAGVPGTDPADIVVIATSPMVTVTVDQPVTVARLTVGSPGFPVTLAVSTAPLTVNEFLHVDSGSQITLAGSVLTLNTFGEVLSGGTIAQSGSSQLLGNAPLVIAGSYLWSGGSMGETGTTTIGAGATMIIDAISQTTTDPSRTLINEGTIIRNGGNGARTDLNGPFHNRGTLVIAPPSASVPWISMNGGGTHTGAMDIAPSSFLRIAGGLHVFESTSSFPNAGRLEITGGEMNVAARGSDLFINEVSMPATGVMSGPGNRSIAIFNFGGGTLTGTGTTTITGTMTIADAAPPRIIGSHTISNLGTINHTTSTAINADTAAIVNAGNLNVGPAPLTIGSLSLIGGALSGSGLVTVLSSFSWSGGAMNGPGSTTIANTVSSSLITGTGARTLNTRPLNILADTIVNATSADPRFTLMISGNSSTLTVGSGATLDFQTNLQLWDQMFPSCFLNVSPGGTLRRTKATPDVYELQVDWTINNSGIVDVAAGFLRATTLNSLTGLVTTGTGASLNLISGTSALGAVAGSGTVYAAFSQVTIAGPWSAVDGGIQVQDATVDLACPVTAAVLSIMDSAPGTTPATTVTLGGATTIGAFALNYGTLAGGPLTVTSTFDFWGGEMAGPGVTTIAPSVTNSIFAMDYPKVLSRQLRIEGNTYYLGAGDLTGNGANITIASGATLEIQTDRSFLTAGAPSTLTVEGTLKKASGTGAFTLGWPVTNTGTIEAFSGTLTFGAGLNNSGILNFLIQSPTIFGRMSVGTTFDMAGTLTATTWYTPSIGDSFQIVSAPSIGGSFATTNLTYPGGVFGLTAGTSTLTLTALGPPNITAISASSGPTSGGRVVVITGTAFATGAQVLFGGAPAAEVPIVEPTRIVAVAPAHAAGPVTIEVVNPNGGGTGSFASPFTFVTPSCSYQYTYVGAGEMRTPVGTPISTALYGGFGYALTWSDGILYTYDLQALAPPHTPFASLTGPLSTLALGTGFGMVRHGQFLYAYGGPGVKIVSLASPAAPVEVGLISGFVANAVVVPTHPSGPVLLTISGTTLGIYSLATPAAPVPLGSFTFSDVSGSLVSVAGSGSVAYVAGWRHHAGIFLKAIDIGAPSSPVPLAEMVPLTPDPATQIQEHHLAYQLVTLGSTLISTGTYEVDVWDVSNPSAPVWISSTGGSGRLAALDGSALVINGTAYEMCGQDLLASSGFDTSGVQTNGFPYGSEADGEFVAQAQYAYTPTTYARVLMLVRKTPPTALADFATTPEDTATVIPVTANDSDAESDPLNISLAAPPLYGSVSCSGGSCTYLPGPDFNGSDSFTYSLSDGYFTATASVTVTVTPVNDAPVAAADVASTVEDVPVTFAVLTNDTDVDGNPLSVGAYTPAFFGSLVLNGDGTFTYTPGANYNGSDGFTYSVTDGSLTAAGSVSITVAAANDAPVAVGDSTTTPEETPVIVDVLANDTDVDGPAPTVVSNTAPSSGTVTCSAASCTYTPGAQFNGSDAFSYTISDGSLTSTATVSVVVTPVNDAPVANPDSASTPEDTPVTIAVLTNDSDIDGDTLTISVATLPANGTVVCSAATCSYAPSAQFNGSDAFSYTISDGSLTATAVVSIVVTATNDPPVANPDSASTAEDTSVTIAVLANDTDVDGNPLTIAVTTLPAGGTVVCGAADCTYYPRANFNGTDSFAYVVSDGLATSAPATVSITVSAVQDNPTAASDTATTTADVPITINVLANDSDVDGEALTVVAWTNGALGTVTCTPAGACTYTPRGVDGLDSFTYTVADSAGGRTVGTVTIDVTPCQNRAPSLVAPDLGARLTPSVRFEWTTSDRALRYRLMAFSATSGMLELAVIPQPVLPLPATIVSTVTLPLGTFSWWVVAEFPDGCPSLNAPERALTIIPACPSGFPEPLEPLEGASIDRTPVVFRWSAVQGALGYTLFVTINDSEKLQAATAPEAEGTPSAALDIPAGATVSWYVEAKLPEGCGTARSRTVRVSASCFPPVLSLQGEVTTDKPYQVRATIVSVGVKYLFEESNSESFATVLAQYEGEVDPTGEFVFATVEHTNVMEPTAYYYRVRLDQQGCAFSDVGRIVVLPLPPPTSTEVQTVVQEGTEEEIRQELFIASPTPDRPTSYTYLTSSDREWMRVEPAGGMIGQSGVTLTIISDPTFLQVGTNVGTVTVTFIELVPGKAGLDTTPVSTSKPVSVTLVTPVTNKGKEAPNAASLIIPAVAHSTGVNSEWQTDIRLLNLGSDRLKYALNLTVSGQDGTQFGKSAEIELASGQNSALNDVVKQWYGLGSLPGEGATGVLEIRPLGPAGPGKGAAAIPVTRSLVSLASSRTYNKTPQGTLGEYIPAIPFASFAGGAAPVEGEKSILSLQQLSQSSAYRSNLGVVEGSGQPVEVEIRFYDAEGAKLLTLPLSLKAGEHRQLNQVLAANDLTNVQTARAEVEVVSGEGKIAAYASVVDNVTGDPLQVSAVDLSKIGARKYVMPGIAHYDTGQARWRTDVQLFNAGLASVSAQVAFYPVGASTPSKMATVDIGPGKIRTLTNVVSTLFGEANTGGAIQISTATNSELVVTGRTYDQRESGSYGQFMSAVTEDDAVGLGDRAIQVLQMEQSSNIRSNLGIVEITGKEVRVELTAFPSESRVNPRAEFTLNPNEFRQMNAVLKTLNAGTSYNARIALRVIGGDGKIVAYGSAVDNMTQDPTYIPGQ